MATSIVLHMLGVVGGWQPYHTYFSHSLIGKFTTRNPHATTNENLLCTHILFGGFANYGEFLQGGPFHAFSQP